MKYYIKYLRMDDDTFFMVSKVSSFIAKQSTDLRNPRNIEDCLMVTLQYVVTGESFQSACSSVPRYSTALFQIQFLKPVRLFTNQ
jgi:hypothetical protein